MKDGRGTMDFRVEGVDAAGNRGTANAGLKVTRWKWAFEAGAGRILGTPAIGQRGTVYFGTSTGTNTGMTFAVKTDGGKRWTSPTGDVGGSVSVGHPSRVMSMCTWRGERTRPPTYAFFGSNGIEKARCQEGGGATEVLGALAVGPQLFANQTLETAMGSFDATDVRYARISGIRPMHHRRHMCTQLLDLQNNPIPPGRLGARS